MNILLTGANGFVGKCLYNTLARQHDITRLSRDSVTQFNQPNIDVLVHLAGRAHVMHDTADDIYKAYFDVNVDYTLKVAKLAKTLKVKRFVFLSSIKVNGENTTLPFNELNAPAPEDAYGQTKHEAEMALKAFFKESDTELVIIRPPLIYGVGVKANLKQLIKLCRLPIPLPFGVIDNKRSLVSLDNLINFIEVCCSHPKAANQTFLISDDEDVSTTELITTIKQALYKKPCLLPVPQALLSLLFKFLGKQKLAQSLLGNLQVDITKAKTLLEWQPVFSFKAGIEKMVLSND